MILIADSLIHRKKKNSLQKDVIVWWTNRSQFGIHGKFFQVNEKILNVPNTFEKHHELPGTG